MSVLSKYIAYLKDNPEYYWFRRKIWGWGWTPATREGWAVLAFFVAVFVWMLVPFLNYVDAHPEADASIVLPFLAKIFLWAAFLILVCWKTGEPPKWQWGLPDKKD